MVTWELIAMMLIPFVMFGVFAAVGVLLVKNSKEVGLRVIGYARNCCVRSRSSRNAGGGVRDHSWRGIYATTAEG